MWCNGESGAVGSQKLETFEKLDRFPILQFLSIFQKSRGANSENFSLNCDQCSMIRQHVNLS